MEKMFWASAFNQGDISAWKLKLKTGVNRHDMFNGSLLTETENDPLL
jgi:hypothetical protein